MQQHQGSRVYRQFVPWAWTCDATRVAYADWLIQYLDTRIARREPFARVVVESCANFAQKKTERLGQRMPSEAFSSVDEEAWRSVFERLRIVVRCQQFVELCDVIGFQHKDPAVAIGI